LSPAHRPLALDLSDRDAVLSHAAQFRSARAVFHLAARLPASDADPLPPHLEGNLRTTENLLEVLADSGVPLILSSTMSVFGRPPRVIPVSEDEIPSATEAYGLTKLAAECLAERMARAGRVPCVVLRYVGIFGVGYNYGAIHLYASKALAGEPISVFAHGRTVRDYVYVDDVVSANVLAAEAATGHHRNDGRGWGLYHIGGGEARTLLEIAQMTADAAGQGSVETNDRPGPFDFAFDIARARADLGYSPLPLAARIAQYVAELRQVPGRV
jgi:UDP-glucose 4-epimerase